MRLPYIVGIIVSAIVGIIVIAFFLKYLRRNTFSIFVWYRDRIWHNSDRSGCILPHRRMTFLSPSRHSRLNEAVGFLLLLAGLAVALGFVSYTPADPSWDTATGSHVHNLLGAFGATVVRSASCRFLASAPICYRCIIWILGWKWCDPRLCTILGFVLPESCRFVVLPYPPPAVCCRPRSSVQGGIRPSGIAGMVIADFLLSRFNLAGSAIIVGRCRRSWRFISSSTFEVASLPEAQRPVARWRACAAPLEHLARSEAPTCHRRQRKPKRRNGRRRKTRARRKPIERHRDLSHSAAPTGAARKRAAGSAARRRSSWPRARA